MVNDSEWILTKQRIIQKVYVLLESVVAEIDRLLVPGWQVLSGDQASPPRIFKGENYLGLPYVTLDHPRLYATDDTLTIRTMFWWGRFMSVTLHAGGIYKEPILQKIIADMDLIKDDMYICVHENQWHHSFEPDNYVLLKNLSEEQLQKIKTERQFIKVAYKLSLQQFNEMQPALLKHYETLAEIIA